MFRNELSERKCLHYTDSRIKKNDNQNKEVLYVMDGMYRKDEIKYKIDTACQMVMYENSNCKDQTWKTILDLQRKLYEQFDLTED